MSQQRKGGLARADKLSQGERTRIARRAAQARWTANGREIHCAIDTGRVSVGELSFSCAVLDDESRVISGTEFMKVMGIYRSGALSTRRHEDDSGVYFPLYLAHKNLRPFIFEDSELVRALLHPIVYREPESQSLAEGIQADVLRRVCTVWVRAHAAGVLGPSQVIVAEKAQKLVESLADVAIIALIDEATGYQKRRARDELQKILAAYIAPELMPWQKMFPNTYYEQLHRVWGWEYIVGSNSRTAYIGKLTNWLIYDKLPPGVLPELRRLNPVDPERKRRRRTHHELLTADVGHPHLNNQINAVTTLLRATPAGNKDFFVMLFNQAFPPPERDLLAEIELEEAALKLKENS